MTIAKEELAQRGIESEELIVGNKAIRGCIGCRKCKTMGKCVFDDLVNETAPKLAEADGAAPFQAIVDRYRVVKP